jgi:hypothetical protein
MESESDNDVLFNKFYNKYKRIIDKKLSRIIINLFEGYKIDFNKCYVLSMKDKYADDISIFDIKKRFYGNGVIHEYSPNRDRLLLFNRVCMKIINEHYKTSPVCRFGFNKELCFDFIFFGPDADIHIYFRILE